MRRFVLIAVTLLAFGSFLNSCGTMNVGATAPPEKLSFERIFTIEDNSQDELYLKVNSWFVKSFNSAESVIEFQDKEAGRVMGKYMFSQMDGIYMMYVRSTITVDIKEGKVRIKCADPMYKYQTGYNPPYSPLVKEAGADKAQTEWAALAESLKSALTDNDTTW